jgi:transposase-like protein
MDNWISDLLIFCAGIAAGVLITTVRPLLSVAKRKRTEMVAARARMLADIKEKHEEEILDEAFRAAEAIRGELDKSMETLRKTLNTVLPAGSQPANYQDRPVIPLSEPVKPS